MFAPSSLRLAWRLEDGFGLLLKTAFSDDRSFVLMNKQKKV